MAPPTSSSELSPRKTYRLMAGIAIAVICLMGLAIFSLSRMQSVPWASSLRDPSILSSFRKNLPQFEHPDLNPQHFEGKWTLLSFWSYGCPPCLEEMPSLNQLALNWSGPELQVITVNTDPEKSENLELAKDFLLEQEITLPSYFDIGKRMQLAFAIEEIPKHFLVDPNKQIVWEAIGAFRWDEASARDQLLKLIERQEAPETDPVPAE